MDCCDQVPIIDVNKHNFVSVWPSIKFAINTSKFIAVDLELSGLGSRKQINAKSVEDRYTALSEVAKTHAIVALGISCFSHKASDNGGLKLKFSVQTFNILVLCQESYTVEPEALIFLVKHGFDFNKQYAAGLPYYRGNDKEKGKREQHLRQMFVEILRSRKPLIFHNGLVDLIFLYQNFYCQLPNTLAAFLADLDEMCPEGIYDTKFIAEKHASMHASYLEYVFRKRQRENANKDENGKAHVTVEFLPYKETSNLVYQRFTIRKPTAISQTICKNYANYGWCGANNGKSCENSHNIDDILDTESSSKKRRRKMEQDSNDHPVAMDESFQGGDNEFGCHRAGQDAFMTGFAFATFLTPRIQDLAEGKDFGLLDDVKNKIHLSGKSTPLLIMTSHFAKTSTAHQEKFKSSGLVT